MFSVRLVSADSYQAQPLPQLDPTFSQFRGSEIKHVPVIRIFGTTSSGEKTCLHVHGVFPYLFVPYTGEEEPTGLAYRLAASLDAAINVSLGTATSNTQHVYLIHHVSGMPFYGYHKKEHQYLKIYFYNPAMIKRASDLLQNGSVLNRSLQPHEAHIPYLLQFMIDYNVYGMSLVNLSGVKHRRVAQSLAELTSSGQSATSDNNDIEYLPATIERQSTCELEIDALASDIMNRREIEKGLELNPGLAAIWEEERARRALAGLQGGDSQLVNPKSPPRPTFRPTDNDIYQEQRLVRRLLTISQCDESTLSTSTNQSVAYAAEIQEGDNLLNSSNLPLSRSTSERNQLVGRDDATLHATAVNTTSEVASQRTTSDSSILGSDDTPLVDLLVQLAGEGAESIDPIELDSLLGSQVLGLDDDKSDNEDDDNVDLNLTSLQLDSLDTLEIPKTAPNEASKSLENQCNIDLTPFVPSNETSNSSRSADEEKTRDREEYRLPQYDGAGDVSPTTLLNSDDEGNGTEAKEMSHLPENNGNCVSFSEEFPHFEETLKIPQNKSLDDGEKSGERCRSPGATDSAGTLTLSVPIIAGDVYLIQYNDHSYEPLDLDPEFGPDLEGLHSSMEIGILQSSADSDSPDSVDGTLDDEAIPIETVLNGDPCFTESAELDKSDLTELQDQYVSLLGNSLLSDDHANPPIDSDLGNSSNYSDSDYQTGEKTCEILLNVRSSPRMSVASRESSSSSENIAPNIQEPETKNCPRGKLNDGYAMDVCKDSRKISTDNSDYNCNVVATWGELQNLQSVDKEKMDGMLGRRSRERSQLSQQSSRQSKRKRGRRSGERGASEILCLDCETIANNSNTLTTHRVNNSSLTQKIVPRYEMKSPVKLPNYPAVSSIGAEVTIAEPRFSESVIYSFELVDRCPDFPRVPHIAAEVEIAHQPNSEEPEVVGRLEAPGESTVVSENSCRDEGNDLPADCGSDEAKIATADVDTDDVAKTKEIPEGYSYYSSERSHKTGGCLAHRHCKLKCANTILYKHVFTSEQMWVIENIDKRKKKRGRQAKGGRISCSRSNCSLPVVSLRKIVTKNCQDTAENSKRNERADSPIEKNLTVESATGAAAAAAAAPVEKSIPPKKRDKRSRGRKNRIASAGSDYSAGEVSSSFDASSGEDNENRDSINESVDSTQKGTDDSELSDWAEADGYNFVKHFDPGELMHNTRCTRRRYTRKKWPMVGNSKKAIFNRAPRAARNAPPRRAIEHGDGIPGLVAYRSKRRGRPRKDAFTCCNGDKTTETPRKANEKLRSVLFENWEKNLVENGRKVTESQTAASNSPLFDSPPVSPILKRNHRSRAASKDSPSLMNRSSTPKKIVSESRDANIPKPSECATLAQMMRDVKCPNTRAKLKLLLETRKRNKANRFVEEEAKISVKQEAARDEKRIFESTAVDVPKVPPTMPITTEKNADEEKKIVEPRDDDLRFLSENSFETVVDDNASTPKHCGISDNSFDSSYKFLNCSANVDLRTNDNTNEDTIHETEFKIMEIEIPDKNSAEELSNESKEMFHKSEELPSTIAEGNFFSRNDYNIEVVSPEIPACLFDEDSNFFEKRASQKIIDDCETKESRDLPNERGSNCSEMSFDLRNLDVYDVESLTPSGSPATLNETPSDTTETALLASEIVESSHFDSSAICETQRVSTTYCEKSHDSHESSFEEASPEFEALSPRPEFVCFGKILHGEFAIHSSDEEKVNGIDDSCSETGDEKKNSELNHEIQDQVSRVQDKSNDRFGTLTSVIVEKLPPIIDTRSENGEEGLVVAKKSNCEKVDFLDTQDKESTALASIKSIGRETNCTDAESERCLSNGKELVDISKVQEININKTKKFGSVSIKSINIDLSRFNGFTQKHLALPFKKSEKESSVKKNILESSICNIFEENFENVENIYPAAFESKEDATLDDKTMKSVAPVGIFPRDTADKIPEVISSTLDNISGISENGPRRRKRRTKDLLGGSKIPERRSVRISAVKSKHEIPQVRTQPLGSESQLSTEGNSQICAAENHSQETESSQQEKMEVLHESAQQNSDSKDQKSADDVESSETPEEKIAEENSMEGKDREVSQESAQQNSDSKDQKSADDVESTETPEEKIAEENSMEGKDREVSQESAQENSDSKDQKSADDVESSETPEEKIAEENSMEGKDQEVSQESAQENSDSKDQKSADDVESSETPEENSMEGKDQEVSQESVQENSDSKDQKSADDVESSETPEEKIAEENSMEGKDQEVSQESAQENSDSKDQKSADDVEYSETPEEKITEENSMEGKDREVSQESAQENSDSKDKKSADDVESSKTPEEKIAEENSMEGKDQEVSQESAQENSDSKDQKSADDVESSETPEEKIAEENSMEGKDREVSQESAQENSDSKDQKSADDVEYSETPEEKIAEENSMEGKDREVSQESAQENSDSKDQKSADDVKSSETPEEKIAEENSMEGKDREVSQESAQENSDSKDQKSADDVESSETPEEKIAEENSMEGEDQEVSQESAQENSDSKDQKSADDVESSETPEEKIAEENSMEGKDREVSQESAQENSDSKDQKSADDVESSETPEEKIAEENSMEGKDQEVSQESVQENSDSKDQKSADDVESSETPEEKIAEENSMEGKDQEVSQESAHKNSDSKDEKSAEEFESLVAEENSQRLNSVDVESSETPEEKIAQETTDKKNSLESNIVESCHQQLFPESSVAPENDPPDITENITDKSELLPEKIDDEPWKSSSISKKRRARIIQKVTERRFSSRINNQTIPKRHLKDFDSPREEVVAKNRSSKGQSRPRDISEPSEAENLPDIATSQDECSPSTAEQTSECPKESSSLPQKIREENAESTNRSSKVQSRPRDISEPSEAENLPDIATSQDECSPSTAEQTSECPKESSSLPQKIREENAESTNLLLETCAGDIEARNCQQQDQSAKNEESTHQPKVKRGRGRPRKIIRMPKRSVVPSTTEAESSVENNTTCAEQTSGITKDSKLLLQQITDVTRMKTRQMARLENVPKPNAKSPADTASTLEEHVEVTAAEGPNISEELSTNITKEMRQSKNSAEIKMSEVGASNVSEKMSENLELTPKEIVEEIGEPQNYPKAKKRGRARKIPASNIAKNSVISLSSVAKNAQQVSDEKISETPEGLKLSKKPEEIESESKGFSKTESPEFDASKESPASSAAPKENCDDVSTIDDEEEDVESKSLTYPFYQHSSPLYLLMTEAYIRNESKYLMKNRETEDNKSPEPEDKKNSDGKKNLDSDVLERSKEKKSDCTTAAATSESLEMSSLIPKRKGHFVKLAKATLSEKNFATEEPFQEIQPLSREIAETKPRVTSKRRRRSEENTESISQNSSSKINNLVVAADTQESQILTPKTTDEDSQSVAAESDPERFVRITRSRKSSMETSDQDVAEKTPEAVKSSLKKSTPPAKAKETDSVVAEKYVENSTEAKPPTSRKKRSRSEKSSPEAKSEDTALFAEPSEEISNKTILESNLSARKIIAHESSEAKSPVSAKKRVRFDLDLLQQCAEQLRAVDSSTEEKIITLDPLNRQQEEFTQNRDPSRSRKIRKWRKNVYSIPAYKRKRQQRKKVNDRLEEKEDLAETDESNNGLAEQSQCTISSSDNVSLDLTPLQEGSTWQLRAGEKSTTGRKTESSRVQEQIPSTELDMTGRTTKSQLTSNSKRTPAHPITSCWCCCPSSSENRVVQLARHQEPKIILKRLSRDTLKTYGLEFKDKLEILKKCHPESDYQVPAYDGPADFSSSESDDDPPADVTIARQENRVCVYRSAKKSAETRRDAIVTPMKRKNESQPGQSPTRKIRALETPGISQKMPYRSPNRTSMLTKSPGRVSGYYPPLQIIVTSPKVRRETSETPDNKDARLAYRDAASGTVAPCLTPSTRKYDQRLHENLLRGRVTAANSPRRDLGDKRGPVSTLGSQRPGELDEIESNVPVEIDAPDDAITTGEGSDATGNQNSMATLRDGKDVRKKLVFSAVGDEQPKDVTRGNSDKLDSRSEDSPTSDENIAHPSPRNEMRKSTEVSGSLANRDITTLDPQPGTSRLDDLPVEENPDLYNVTTDPESDDDDDDVCNLTFTQYIDSQMEKNQILTLDRSKIGADSNDIVSLRPKFNPPSRQRILDTLETYGIPKYRNQEPFFSDEADVPKQKELAQRMLKVPGKSLKDLQRFVSSVAGVTGLARWRKLKINELQPSLARSKDIGAIRAIVGDGMVNVRPVTRPPTQKEVKNWLRAREYLEKRKKQEEMTKKSKEEQQKIEVTGEIAGQEDHECGSNASDLSVVEASPEKIVHVRDSDKTLNYTLKMKLAKRGLGKKAEEMRDSKAITSVQNDSPEANESRGGPSPTSQHSDSNEMDPSLLSVLQKSRLFKEQEASRQLGLSRGQIDFLSDSTRSNVADENLQNAKALTRYQYLTIMCLEVHVNTRGDLLPDSQHDSISAIFYSVQSDVPPTSSIKPLEHGVIILADEEKAKNKMHYSYASSVPWSVGFAHNEEALLNALVTLITRVDPEILIGWELETLSWGYVFQRASRLGMNLSKRISRIPATQCKWETPAPEIESMADVKLPGRIVLDIWRIMRHEAALLSYTFESMMHHILNERVPCPSFKILTSWWNLSRPRSLRWRVVEHYSLRVLGIFRMLDQLDIIGRTSELARLFGIQFYEVFSRGSQYRVESVMHRLAKPLNFIAVSPSPLQRASMRAMEALPLIMEPESMFYTDPLIVLDFQSLYPSIIIAHNYCFSTCLGRIEHIGQPQPFEFGAYTLRVPKNTALKLQGKVNYAPCGVAFVKPEVRLGILPRMLTEILETRFMVKKAMKDHKKADKTLQRALHSRQLGLKLLANVTYGYTAANFSGRMPCMEVGDSVVSKSKETLERAIKLVESTPKWGARVVYGDTDSLFILVPGKSKADAFVIGNEIADAVTASNPPPIKLKFEKVMYPSILQTKKRYCGYMYETPEQETPTYLAKGIETVRRDGCPAVSKILEKTLKILFETKDVSLVKKYVTRQLDKVLSGKVSIQDLTFAKEFRGLKGYKAKACVPALELTRRLMRKDPRAVPRNSERVRYVIVAGAPNQALIHCVRTPWELINDPGLRPNAVYYVTRVIIPPLNRCLNLMGVDVNAWYRDMPHRQILHNPVGQPIDKQKLTIFQYFGTIVCVSCGQPSSKGICTMCSAHPADTLVVLHEKLRWLHRTYDQVTSICQSCVGQADVADCSSLDCPVLYRRSQTQRELSQSTHLRNIIECGDNLEF